MSDEQREMTLEEWCDRLPASHRVNRELQDLKQREAELVEALEELEDHDAHRDPEQVRTIARAALAKGGE
jgi:cell division protein FtsB